MATFSLVVESLFLIRSKGPGHWDPMSRHVPCLALAMYYSSDYVAHLSALRIAIVSSEVMVSGPLGRGLSSRFSLLNSTVHFFTVS